MNTWGVFPIWGDPVIKPETEAMAWSQIRMEPPEELPLGTGTGYREGGFRRHWGEELKKNKVTEQSKTVRSH